MMQRVTIKNKTDPLIIMAITFYAMIYEWGIFEAAPKSLIFAIKVFLPCLLLLLIPLRKVNFAYFNKFIIFFVLFMIWGLIPTVFSGCYEETIVQWFKFLPRLLFFILIGVYLLRRPEASIVLVKLFIIIGIFTVIQFFLLILTKTVGITVGTVEMARGTYYGPYGLLGNGTARMYFPDIQGPIFRLCGFWLEPSRASGFMFAVYFLAKGLYILEKKKLWKLASYSCLIGGFLCFSNAGYLAIATALFFGVITQFKMGKRTLRSLFLIIIIACLVVTVFWGRSLVAQRYYHVDVLRAIVGVRGTVDVTLAKPDGGRLELMKENIPIWLNNPFGIGFRIPGDFFFEQASGCAPLTWFSYTGFFGIVLLLLREKQVIVSSLKFSTRSDYCRNVCQAWVAMFTQHLVYGSWMSPVYLILCALVFCAAYNTPFFNHITSTSPATSNFSFKNTPKGKR